MKPERLDILEQFRFFQRCSDAQRARIIESAMLTSLDDGDYYFKEGDSCTHLALLGAGDIRVYKSSEAGREITLYHVLPGESCILTASCLLSNISYPAHAVVDSAATAVLFPAGIFRQWVSEWDCVRDFVFESLSTRLAVVMALIEEISFRKVDKRLAEFLLRRFRGDREFRRVLSITHEQLAMELGSAREVISRLLKEFERLGVIRLERGRVYLSDENKLIDFLKDF
jgi:CRP/FNR family transcriptional regulator